MTWQYTPRVAVVRGLRTPFAQSGTHFARLTALDLGKIVVAELVQRAGIDPNEVQELDLRQRHPVGESAKHRARDRPRHRPSAKDSRLHRRQGLRLGQSGHHLRRRLIFRGYADVVIAGGSESLSDIPILFSKNFSDALVSASKQKSVGGKLGAFSKVRPKDLAPDAPAIAESTTGLTMGESAEKMAKENGITREAQDRFALQSHLRAAAATRAGRFKDEVMTVVVPPAFDNIVETDNLIRGDSTLEGTGQAAPGLRSQATAPSPPATPRRSPTAPRRYC